MEAVKTSSIHTFPVRESYNDRGKQPANQPKQETLSFKKAGTK